MTPDEIHRIGLEQDRELEGRMDAILKSQGLTKGSVADRTQALTRDPKNLFADTDAGELAVGTPLAMVYRIKELDRLRGFRRYFWKATPVRQQEGQ